MIIDSPILMSENEIDFLHEFIKNNVSPNGIILELGSWKGGSTIVMASTGRRVLSVDYWGDTLFQEWKANITKAGVDHLVIPIRGEDIQVISPWLPQFGGMVEFVLIDTSHTYPQTKKEFQLVYPLVASNGWIFLHDIGHPDYPGCAQAWEELKPILRNHTGVQSLLGGQK